MSKTKLYLFYIFTFGIGYFVLKKKAKEHAKKVNDELTLTKDVLIDVDDFIKHLGGIENIKGASSSISSIKINVLDVQKIKQEQIKEMGAKGIMISDGFVTCLFGDFSKELCKQLLEKLEK